MSDSAAAAAQPAAAAASAAPAASSSAPSALSREIGPIRQPKASFRLALPVWSQAPQPPYDNLHCEVYEKEGVINQRLYLSKARGHSFGRHAEWCDQVLPKINSISRQHAAVVHTKIGPVLLDLFSSHGTTLNGVKLQSGQPYLLYEGDVCRFGGAPTNYKFKGTGRPKRDSAHPVEPIVPPAGYVPQEEESSASAADGSAAAQPAPGDKRKREGGDAATAQGGSRKEARNERGSRSVGGADGGLPDPARDRIRCRHLLVKHRGSRRPSSWRQETITISKEEARDKLAAIREKLVQGNPAFEQLEAKFIELAKVESDCNSAKMGGDLGFFEFKKMQPPFSEAAFKLRVGDLSGIVESDSGVHIIFRKE